ncbi:MAG TPA: hypothetical protein VFH73_27720 [Polyangia bacterium]|nr:hypothetical protein [Polyangia bacterium]
MNRLGLLWALIGFGAAACSGGGSFVGGSGGAGTGGTSGGTGETMNPPQADGSPVEAASDTTTPVPPADADFGDSGAASDGATADSGPSAPCPGGALLCDDFEKYLSPADLTAAWKPTASGGATLTVDNTKPWKGGKSLHIKATAGTPTAVIVKEGAPLFPIPGNVMYGRVMMWLAGTPGGGYHWNSIQGAGVIPASKLWGKYGWGGQNGKVLAGYTVRPTANGAISMDCSKPSVMAFPDQRWVCLEWAFDGNKNEMHMWFDGKLLADADIVGMGTRCVNGGDLGKPWAGPTFSTISIGWQQYQPSSGPLEVWLDDLVVDKQPIGCSAP